MSPEASHRIEFLPLQGVPIFAFLRYDGLLSYAPDTADLLHRAAGSIGHILRGAKPAEIPFISPSSLRPF
jgi:hypothetical protein